MKIKDSQVSKSHEKTWGFHPKLGKTKEIYSISFITISLQDSFKTHQTYINTAFLYNFCHTLLLHHIPAIPNFFPAFKYMNQNLGKYIYMVISKSLKLPKIWYSQVFKTWEETWGFRPNLGKSQNYSFHTIKKQHGIIDFYCHITDFLFYKP